MTTAMLKRHSVQSITDQTDYRKMAVIAVNAASALTPEQCAIWSYPLVNAGKDEIIFNMVNSMLLRIHQSGKITEISDEGLYLVEKAIRCYKSFRNDIPNSIPFWPLGLANFSSKWLALGLDCGKKSYLAVWRMDTEEDFKVINLKNSLTDKVISIEMIYPEKFEKAPEFSSIRQEVTVFLPRKYTAGIISLHT